MSATDLVIRGRRVVLPGEVGAASIHAWTDQDGRVKPFFLVEQPINEGTYRLVFDTEPYYSSLSLDCFYPQVTVVFKVNDSSQHYHVPLLMSPYGFSTYRGS